MRACFATLSLTLVLTAPLAARAAAPEDDWDGGYDVKAERRSGFAGSLGLGSGLFGADGYPNAVAKIDNPDYETSTGAALGTAGSLWLGGALRDWFLFGLGVVRLNTVTGGDQAVGTAFILHIEAYPLWASGGWLRDASLYTNLGAGSLHIQSPGEDADGGAVSVLSLGASYEIARFGPLALGPIVEGDYWYSQSASIAGGLIGARMTVYGGP
jgi:hypothetical protein